MKSYVIILTLLFCMLAEIVFGKSLKFTKFSSRNRHQSKWRNHLKTKEYYQRKYSDKGDLNFSVTDIAPTTPSSEDSQKGAAKVEKAKTEVVSKKK